LASRWLFRDEAVLRRHTWVGTLATMHDDDLIDVAIPGYPDDPRDAPPPPEGVRVRYGPPLHPDDVTTVDGIPVTSVSRTLIDLAEVLDRDDLREVFENARARGLLDMDALRASRGRVEWRPSLAMLDEVIEEFAST
jgi:hypothetical protein